MLIKLSAWSTLEIRMQGEETIKRLKMVSLKGERASNILE
jgi:hypothetical protein